MKKGDLINCGICILIGFLLYSFIQNGLCDKEDLLEGFCWTQWGPKNVGESCEYDSDCNCWTGKNMKCLVGEAFQPAEPGADGPEGKPKSPCFGTCANADNWEDYTAYIRGGDKNEPEPGPGGGCGLPNWGK